MTKYYKQHKLKYPYIAEKKTPCLFGKTKIDYVLFSAPDVGTCLTPGNMGIFRTDWDEDSYTAVDPADKLELRNTVTER